MVENTSYDGKAMIRTTIRGKAKKISTVRRFSVNTFNRLKPNENLISLALKNNNQFENVAHDKNKLNYRFRQHFLKSHSNSITKTIINSAE